MTREVFWHFPGWLEAVWYVLATASVGVFAYGVVPAAGAATGAARGGPPCELRRRP